MDRHKVYLFNCEVVCCVLILQSRQLLCQNYFQVAQKIECQIFQDKNQHY